MASGSININVRGGIDGVSSPTPVPKQEPKKLKEPIKRVEVTLKDTKSPNTSTPSNTEILNHVENVLRSTSGVAKSVGADDAAEILDHSADIAERIPVAVEGIKREIEPVKESVNGLWNALERKGIVGHKPKVNLGDMRKKNK
jgi:hypothetical protein